MRVIGIIAEYNPFHNGHLYQLKKSKEITGANYCIVIMSGNFVQRGEPAIVDKWTRAKMALLGGADLVLELPIHFATSSAEFFSYASVSLLNNLGIVDTLCFGSEVGKVDILQLFASILNDEPNKFKNILTKNLQQGYSFASARSTALLEYIMINNLVSITDEELSTIIKSPNNILGIEYIKSLLKLDSSITPFTIKRVGAHYHDTDINQKIASASAIRTQLKANPVESIQNKVPLSSYHAFLEAMNKKFGPVFPNDFSSLLGYKIKSSSAQLLEQYLDVTEGIENRIKTAASSSFTLQDMVSHIATKRYPITKIQRALIHILLNIKKDTFKSYVDNGYLQYIKVLGFRKESSVLLKNIKKTCNLPIISNVKDSMPRLNTLQQKMLGDEIMSTEIYNHIVESKYGVSMKNDFTQQVVIV